MKKIYIFFIFCSVLSKSTIAQGTWNAIASLPDSARYAAKALSIGNKGYLVAGRTGISNPSFSNDLWEYDPKTNSWTTKAPFPGVGRYGPAGFVIGGKMYIVCGISSSNTVTNETWEYDPGTNIWTSKANFPGVSRYDATAFVLGNKAYVGSGSTGGPPYLKDFYEYDPSTNTWSTIASLPVVNGRSGAIGFTIGDTGYVALGQYQSSTPFFHDLWAYSVSTNSWTQKANYPGDGQDDSRVFTICNEAYVATGWDSVYNASKSFYQYDAASNKWSSLPQFPGSGRWFGVAFAIGDTGYVGTGRDNSNNPFKDFYGYTPSGPKSNFSYILPSACSGNISFTDQSSNGPNTWKWTFPGGNPDTSSQKNPSVTFSGNSTDTVTLIVSNCLGSDTSIQVIVISNSINVTATSSSSSICTGATVQLTASGATTYSWYPAAGLSNSTISNPIAAPTVTTTYTVIGSSNGCVDSTTLTITVNPIPSVVAADNSSLTCSGNPVILSATGADTYSWSPGNLSGNPVTVNPQITTTYLVTGTSNNCSDTASIVVTVNEGGNIELPNAFTPNGDGINDIFRILNPQNIELTTFNVYDRWGELVFTTNDPNIGWDGTFNGNKSLLDVYVWYVQGKTANCGDVFKKGNVTLVR